MRVFDCFPFFNELDVLEVRLNELDPVVDRFVIIESRETYGGQPKPAHLENHWKRLKKFHHKILYWKVDGLNPPCINMATGRLREACQRNILSEMLHQEHAASNDVVLLSDCDEIPRATSVRNHIENGGVLQGMHRFKQRSYYYNVNTQVDYGHDFASRARIGLLSDFTACGSMYAARHFHPEILPGIENGGWHFGYFGGTEKIKTKVAALAWHPDYRIGNVEQDVKDRHDLHGRQFVTDMLKRVDDNDLPAYLLSHHDQFSHFWEEKC